MLRTTALSLLLLSSVLFAEPEFAGTTTTKDGVVTALIQTNEPFEKLWLWIGDQYERVAKVRSIRDVDFYSFEIPTLTFNSKPLFLTGERADRSQMTLALTFAGDEVSFRLHSDRTWDEILAAKREASLAKVQDQLAKVDEGRLETALNAIELINRKRKSLNLTALEVDAELCLESRRERLGPVTMGGLKVLPGASFAVIGQMMEGRPEVFMQSALTGGNGYVLIPGLTRVGFSIHGGLLVLDLAGPIGKPPVTGPGLGRSTFGRR